MNRFKKKQKSFLSVFPMITILGMAIIIFYSSYHTKEWYFDWSGIRTEIKDTVLIAKDLGIESSYIGYSGSKSTQNERQRWLMSHANTVELRKLTKYPKATIKAIAYEGLLRDSRVKGKTTIALEAIRDTVSQVYTLYGCIGDQMNLSRYIMLHGLKRNLVYILESKESKEKHNFTTTEAEFLLSEYDRMQGLEKFN